MSDLPVGIPGPAAISAAAISLTGDRTQPAMAFILLLRDRFYTWAANAFPVMRHEFP